MKLKIGSYKNYKILCEENGLEIKTGKSKQLQMKEIERLYDFHKEGNKIVIDKEKEEPKEKVDGRKIKGKVDGRKNNGKGTKYSYYADYIDKLILHTLYENNGDISFTLRTLFTEEIKLFNKDGINELSNANDKQIDKKFKINGYWNKQYMYMFRNIYTDMFKSACKRLEKKGYIEYYRDYMYVNHGSTEKKL